MTGEGLTPQQVFVASFMPLTRVGLNSDAVWHSNWPIDLHITSSRDEVGSWFFPWYVGLDGTRRDWDDVDARPMAVGEWLALRDTAAPADRREGVDIQAAWFRRLRERGDTISVVVPAYALPRDGRLILDGNHRLAALMQEADLSFHCTAVTLHGPPDEAVLADLRHWPESSAV